MQRKSRTEYSLLNILTGLGGYVINTILGFVCRMVFVRCLSDSYLGINGLMTNFLSMLSLAELGIGTAIFYALYEPLADKDEHRVLGVMQLLAKVYRAIALILTMVGLIFMPFLTIIAPEARGLDYVHLLFANFKQQYLRRLVILWQWENVKRNLNIFGSLIFSQRFFILRQVFAFTI